MEFHIKIFIKVEAKNDTCICPPVNQFYISQSSRVSDCSNRGVPDSFC
jgi:hypothetical protein